MPDLTIKLQAMKKQRPMLASLPLSKRNQILRDLPAVLIKNQKSIIKANEKDLKSLTRGEMADRLKLTPKRIAGMAKGLKLVASLPDPLNALLEKRVMENGLAISKTSVPLGTVGVIYESRPNVTVDLAGLALKSGNALVLKGGSEAHQTNTILVGLMHKVLKQHRLPINLIYLIDPKTDWKKGLLNAHGLVDVLIPRGGEGLIKWVRENSKIPVIETGAGVCHIFVDEKTNIRDAVKIIVNAKTQRPSVCNALDTLVVHQKALNNLMVALAAPLAEHQVEILADSKSHQALSKIYRADLLRHAKPEDYGKEFLSLRMSIKTVETFDQGLEFIKQKTSGHSEAILSTNKKHISRFLNEVDAAVVYANASTRFTDGEEFGMGAEVGVSTQKLHARGPMGLQALVSYKWVVKGSGQIRK